MRRVLLVWLASATMAATGCAAVMSANAHHNSRGTACIDTPAFAIIDLAIAFGGVGAVAASETSRGYYAIPGVFLASGVIGGISAVACREGHANDTEQVAAPPASNTAPSFGDADVDPDAIDPVTEPGVAVEPPAEPPAPLPSQPVPWLRLPADYTITPQPARAPTPPDDTIACRDNPGACPPGQTCAIAGDAAGTCVPE